MSSIFTSLGRTVLAGFVLLALIVLALGANLGSIELPFLALCEIQWVTKFELPAQKIDHVDEVLDIAVATSPSFG